MSGRTKLIISDLVMLDVNGYELCQHTMEQAETDRYAPKKQSGK